MGGQCDAGSSGRGDRTRDGSGIRNTLDGIGGLEASEAFAACAAATLAATRTAKQVLFALDFDGTLAPIVLRPGDAYLPAGTESTLRRLSARQHVSVAVVSGRSLRDLRSKISVDAIYAGNHGLEIEGRGFSFTHEDARLLRDVVDAACWELEVCLQGVPGVLVESKELTATVHFREAPPDLAEWIEASIRHTLQPYDSCLRVSRARKAWEVRPRIDWNKGSALEYILQQFPEEPLVICAGDDTTDEDMFQVSTDMISIHVGKPVPTAARYSLTGPEELAELLWLVAEELKT